MMKRSQRGAAKISVVWAICLFMAFAAAAVAYFMANQETATQRERADREVAARQKMEAELLAQRKYALDVTKTLGFTDPTNPSVVDAKVVEEQLKHLKASFPQIDASIANIHATIPFIVDAYKAEARKAQEANARVAELTAENNAIRGNVDQVRTELEKQLSDKTRQLADAEQSFNDQKAELERSNAERTEAWRLADQQVQKLRQEIEEVKRKGVMETDSWRTRMAEAERKLTPFVKEPEAADGRILAVSPELRIGWINLGAQNRLARGMRFRVVDGQHGSKRVKAWAEVTGVENGRAEVAFSAQVDPYDPPVAGDVIFNPVYDPTGERSAVLVGRFSGAMSRESLLALLKSMNITVTKNLDKSTDFLIVGGEEYHDPETGQPLETPVQPSDLPIYKEAQAEGVQIVALKELRQYFAAN
jgi:hypothetical protein